MAIRLPYSRVVDVSLTREENFATARGFQVALIVQTKAVAGKVDASNRTRVYSDMTEVAVDFTASDEAYKAAAAVFAQNPRPRQIKIGYVDPGVLDTAPSPTITSELDAVYAADTDWYWLLFTSDFRDTSVQEDIADWAETHDIIVGLDSNDSAIENPLSTGSIADYIRDRNYDRSYVFYHTDTSLYPAAALTGFLATRDLDRSNLQTARRGSINSGQAYTAKFKKLRGITALNKPSAIVQAITGFVPGIGLDKNQGHLANTYVNIGGLDMVVEGNVGSGAFIDEIHAGDWIVARTREALLSTLSNNPRIPYTNAGVAILTNTIDGVMRRAFAAGIIASDTGEEGEYLPEYEISVDRVENIPPSQRRNRIAPDITVDFRYAGAFHYVTSRLIMRF